MLLDQSLNNNSYDLEKIVFETETSIGLIQNFDTVIYEGGAMTMSGHLVNAGDSGHFYFDYHNCTPLTTYLVGLNLNFGECGFYSPKWRTACPEVSYINVISS